MHANPKLFPPPHGLDMLVAGFPLPSSEVVWIPNARLESSDLL